MNPKTLGLLALLTLSAGYADAVAFFGMGVFTANMTGNTVLLGGALVARAFGNLALPGNLGAALPSVSIGAFVAGSFIAASVLRGETGRRRTLAMLGAVVVLIAAGAALQPASGTALVAAVGLLSAAMGVQSVIAVRAGLSGVSTTFVTGTLVMAVTRLLGVRPERIEGVADGGIWLCYLTGAAAGTAGLHVLGPHALWVPAAVVAILAPMV